MRDLIRAARKAARIFLPLCERTALVPMAGEAEEGACASQTDELETFVHAADIVKQRKGSLPAQTKTRSLGKRVQCPVPKSR